MALAAVRTGTLAGLLLGLVLARGGAPALGTGMAAAAAAAYVALERNRHGGRIWLAYVGGFLAFAYLRQLADDLGVAVHAGYVVTLDASLPGADVPTVWLQRLAFDPGRVAPWDVAAVAVYLSYFVVPHVVAFALWRRASALFGRYCIAALTMFYAGLVACVVVPTAPPWLAARDGLLPAVARVVPDVIGRADASAYARGSEALGPNPVAAMPSLHMAGAVLVGLVLWRWRRSARVIAIAYPAAMALTLVYTGEHYVADVVLGAALAAAAWTWAPALAARLAALGGRPRAVALERP